MKSGPERDSRPAQLPLMVIFIGLLALGLSWIRTGAGFATRHDPGPWLLPRLLAVLLVAGGVGLWFRRERTEGESPAEKGLERVPSEQVRGRPLVELLLGLAAYLLLLPLLGYLPVTMILVGLFLWRQDVVWWRAASAALILTVAVYCLFALGFKVPLPAGLWR